MLGLSLLSPFYSVQEPSSHVGWDGEWVRWRLVAWGREMGGGVIEGWGIGFDGMGDGGIRGWGWEHSHSE